MILVLSIFLQIGIKVLLNHLKIQDVGYNPKLITVLDHLFYVFAFNMVCFCYCVDSLYVMFAI